jgi:hypothetical protein
MNIIEFYLVYGDDLISLSSKELFEHLDAGVNTILIRSGNKQIQIVAAKHVKNFLNLVTDAEFAAGHGEKVSVHVLKRVQFQTVPNSHNPAVGSKIMVLSENYQPITMYEDDFLRFGLSVLGYPKTGEYDLKITHDMNTGKIIDMEIIRHS